MSSTKAIIDLSNLRNNIHEIRKFIPSTTKLLMPVKANAYGHGTLICAKTAQEEGIDYLAIARVSEGKLLRENGITLPILLFSLCSPDEIEEAVKYDITPFAFDKEYINLFAEAVKKAGKTKYPIHIAVDSGMGRIGCYKEEAADIAKAIISTEVLTLEGMCTHMAVSDSLTENNVNFTDTQFNYFCEAVENVKKAGINPGICHCANSAATFNNNKMHLDMVRPGITFYGYYPDQITKEYLSSKGTPATLKPVMTFTTEVCSIRHFTKGQSVGYGRTWTASEDTDIAVLPVGYGDGLFRRFSTQGLKVAINGKEYPVVGRICMDQCMVNIGNNSGIKRWDKVIIFGDKKYGALQDAETLASATSTISYEITTEIADRVERVTNN